MFIIAVLIVITKRYSIHITKIKDKYIAEVDIEYDEPHIIIPMANEIISVIPERIFDFLTRRKYGLRMPVIIRIIISVIRKFLLVESADIQIM